MEKIRLLDELLWYLFKWGMVISLFFPKSIGGWLGEIGMGIELVVNNK